MDFVINFVRVITAVIAPAGVIVFVVLTVLKVAKVSGTLPEEGQQCLCCGGSNRGAEGRLYYTENFGNHLQRSTKRQLLPGTTPILGAESYFICDRCAFRYIRNEIIQMILMVVPYPLYLYLIVPMFAENGVFANFLIETLLVVLSVGGFTSALDLFRATCFGDSPLMEARDRAAIHERRKALGKKFSYYTRSGASHLKG